MCLTVNDGALDSDPVCTLAVVYDPSGGWIDSPADACKPDASLNGRATFGFVSKKGATAPEGNTEFQFQVGGFNFHSTAYGWLVVDNGGATAQFKGSGLVNDALDPKGVAYKFMLWAIDGAISDGSDGFRICIWCKGNDAVEHDVYDKDFNQAVAGGSTVVHTKWTGRRGERATCRRSAPLRVSVSLTLGPSILREAQAVPPALCHRRRA